MSRSNLVRTFSGDWLNAIVNHRDILDWVRGPLEGPLDLTALVADPANVVLATPLGGFFFHPVGERRWEVHTQFLPAGRDGVLGLAREAATYMFTKTACDCIQTRVPETNTAARRLTEAMQFKHIGPDGTWPIRGRNVPNHLYELTRETWEQSK